MGYGPIAWSSNLHSGARRLDTKSSKSFTKMYQGVKDTTRWRSWVTRVEDTWRHVLENSLKNRTSHLRAPAGDMTRLYAPSSDGWNYR